MPRSGDNQKTLTQAAAKYYFVKKRKLPKTTTTSTGSAMFPSPAPPPLGRTLSQIFLPFLTTKEGKGGDQEPRDAIVTSPTPRPLLTTLRVGTSYRYHLEK